MKIETLPAADAMREKLRARFPEQWALGIARETERLGPPPEFERWSPEQRDAYFAAAYVVAIRRIMARGAE